MNWPKELTRLWTLVLGALLIGGWCAFFDWPDWSALGLLVLFALWHRRWIDSRFAEVSE